jgi:hypothetical protein
LISGTFKFSSDEYIFPFFVLQLFWPIVPKFGLFSSGHSGRN